MYEGKKVYAFSGQDPDFWSYFEACDVIQRMDSEFDVEDVKLWWKYRGGSLEEDLKSFKND